MGSATTRTPEWHADPDFVAQAERIHAAIAPESDLTDKLLRINRHPSGGR